MSDEGAVYQTRKARWSSFHKLSSVSLSLALLRHENIVYSINLCKNFLKKRKCVTQWFVL